MLSLLFVSTSDIVLVKISGTSVADFVFCGYCCLCCDVGCLAVFAAYYCYGQHCHYHLMAKIKAAAVRGSRAMIIIVNDNGRKPTAAWYISYGSINRNCNYSNSIRYGRYYCHCKTLLPQLLLLLHKLIESYISI